MGGTAANRLTAAKSGITGTTLGASGGSEDHTLTTNQMPLHGHPFRSRSDTISSPTASTTGGFLMNSGATGLANRAAFTGTPSDTNGEQIGGTGGGLAHNNTQPTLVLNKIIKT
jgi:microcystin-dependent protein